MTFYFPLMYVKKMLFSHTIIYKTYEDVKKHRIFAAENKNKVSGY